MLPHRIWVRRCMRGRRKWQKTNLTLRMGKNGQNILDHEFFFVHRDKHKKFLIVCEIHPIILYNSRVIAYVPFLEHRLNKLLR